jgi:hypothetical protein
MQWMKVVCLVMVRITTKKLKGIAVVVIPFFICYTAKIYAPSFLSETPRLVETLEKEVPSFAIALASVKAALV